MCRQRHDNSYNRGKLIKPATEVTFASDTKTYIGTIRGGRIVNTVSEKVRRVVAVGEADTPHGAAYQAILNYQARANNSN